MAGDAAASSVRFFLDRGLGAVVVPRALRAAGWTLETMDERYGAGQSQNVQDTQWIEEATLAGDVLLCKDLAIAQNPLEAQAIYMTSARVFALVNPSYGCAELDLPTLRTDRHAMHSSKTLNYFGLAMRLLAQLAAHLARHRHGRRHSPGKTIRS